jgi:hypothetical protein
MGNIFLYTTEKQPPRFKNQGYWITRNNALKAERVMKVARLEYGGSWNPEPGGWERLTNLLHNEHKLDLDVQPVKLGEGKLGEFKLAHLTGNTKFHLTAGQRDELKRFGESGGLLIVDACGGSGEFASAAEAELASIYGVDAQQLQTVLKTGDPLFSSSAAGEPIDTFGYRRYAQKLLVGHANAPQLRAIMKGGKPRVYYSPQDLSVGMVGMSVDGIYGYDPATATAIMRNIMLQAAPGASVAGALEPPPAPPAGAAAADPPAQQEKPKDAPAKPGNGRAQAKKKQ